MKDIFEMAAGSAIGRNHLLEGKNNQDAYCAVRSEQATIAVVCDGCSSGKHSEVGAKLGARLVVNTIVEFLKIHAVDSPDTFLEKVRQEILIPFQAMAEIMGGNFSQIITDYFQFTILGVMLTPAGAVIFSLGDGAIVVNGQAMLLEKTGDLTAYLTDSLLNGANVEQSKFQIHQQLKIEEVESILIGTDGVHDLIKISASKSTGELEKGSAIAQFWLEDQYFQHPERVKQKLATFNIETLKFERPSQKRIQSEGFLPNDTTLIAIRKRSLK